MNLQYFKSKTGNFGDDLNPWLWPKLIGNFDRFHEDVDFFGIGSILDERIESGRRALIFGSGVRDFLYTPKMHQLDVRFVRGPISSRVFRNSKYVADSAYALKLVIKDSPSSKKYKYSFIPYFRHIYGLNWAIFERISGIKVIYPTSPVEQVIDEINNSEYVYTAAMHGAILADLFRVPWQRVKFSSQGYESNLTSELKWFDWHSAFNIDQIPVITMGFSPNAKDSRPVSLAKMFSIIHKLKEKNFTLSSDAVLEQKLNQIHDEVEFVKDNYLK